MVGGAWWTLVILGDESEIIHLSNLIYSPAVAIRNDKAEFLRIVFVLSFSNSTILFLPRTLLGSRDDWFCTVRTQQMFWRSWIRARAVPGKQRQITPSQKQITLWVDVSSTHSSMEESTTDGYMLCNEWAKWLFASPVRWLSTDFDETEQN